MAQISNFFIKNLDFNYIPFFKILFIDVNNSEFFTKTNRITNVFVFNKLNIKKINLSKKCINIVYF